MKNFGFAGYDNVDYIGTNGKMTEICAAMGLTSLESLDLFIATNYRNYTRYRESLAGIPGLRMLTYNEQERCNYQYIVLEVDEAEVGSAATNWSRSCRLKTSWRAAISTPAAIAWNRTARTSRTPACSCPKRRNCRRASSCQPALLSGPDEVDTICAIIRYTIAHGGKITNTLIRRTADGQAINVP
jgi:hypothetical protein